LPLFCLRSSGGFINFFYLRESLLRHEACQFSRKNFWDPVYIPSISAQLFCEYSPVGLMCWDNNRLPLLNTFSFTPTQCAICWKYNKPLDAWKEFCPLCNLKKSHSRNISSVLPSVRKILFHIFPDTVTALYLVTRQERNEQEGFLGHIPYGSLDPNWKNTPISPRWVCHIDCWPYANISSTTIPGIP